MAVSPTEARPRYLRLALGDLAGDRVRTLLAIAAVVPLVVAYFIVFAVAEGILTVADRTAADTALVVASTNVLDLSSGSIDDEDLALFEDLAGTDVVAVTPMVFRFISVDDTLVHLRAADVPTWEERHDLEVISGALPASRGEVAVSEAVEQSLGWTVGTTLPIYGSDFRVSGVLRAPGTKAVSVWMPLDQAQELFDARDDYQLAFLHLAPDADPDDLIDRLESDPRLADDYVVLLESRLAVAQSATMRTAGQISFFAVGLALAMIGFGSFNFSSLILAERQREAGVVRALGFSARFLRRLITVRVVLVGVAAYLVGLAIAWVYLASRPVVSINAFAVPLRATPAAIGVGLIVVIALSWFAGRLAARRYVRTTPGALLEG